MDKIQKNQNEMFNRLDLVFSNYSEDIEKDEELKEVVAIYNKGRAEITKYGKIQMIDIRGITQEKLVKEDNLVNSTFDMLSRIKSLAAKTKNKELYEKADHTISSLRNLSNDELYYRALNVYDMAIEYSEALKPFGVDEQMREDYGKEANAYINYTAAPRIAIENRANATKMLAELFPKQMVFINYTLNPNMVRFNKTNPEFYASYLLACSIVDGPTYKLAAMGTTIDEETKLALENVSITFTLKEGTGAVTVVRTAISTALGNWRIKTLEEGAYMVSFSRPEYDTITMNLYYFKNRQLRLNVALRKTE